MTPTYTRSSLSPRGGNGDVVGAGFEPTVVPRQPIRLFQPRYLAIKRFMTRVGKFLRRTSLDELPQILNVVRGEMSLVGPRPTSFSMDTYSLWHTERLEVLPGITGLWQVLGRSEVDFDDRVRLDIEYIENQSFWLDMSILLRTAGAVFSRRGAY